MEQIRELEKEFIGRGEVRGFKFTQIKCNDRGFLYEVDNNGTIYYEVFKRRVNTQYSNVSYPSSKSFGLWAWWCKDYSKALDKYHNLPANKSEQ